MDKSQFSYHLNILVSSSPDPPLSAPVHPTVSPDHSSQRGYLLLGYTGLTEPTKYNERIRNYKWYMPQLYSSSFLKIVKTKPNKFMMLNYKKSKKVSLLPHFAFNERKSMSRSRRSCRTGTSRGSGYKRADRGGRLPIKWILFTSALKMTMMREHKTKTLNKELRKESSWI